jgi:hypothetical protein
MQILKEEDGRFMNNSNTSATRKEKQQEQMLLLSSTATESGRKAEFSFARLSRFQS